MSEDKTTTLDWAQLRQSLVESFDDNELRDLCFDLRIDYGSARDVEGVRRQRIDIG